MGMLWDYWYAPVATQEGVREVATPFKTKARSCTDIACLFLFLFCLVGWIAVAVIAFRDGDPRKVLYPTNSRGEICGQGKFKDKAFMMMFDLSRCIGLGGAIQGCPTPSVCVAACPDIDWQWEDGKIDGLESYCQGMAEGQYEASTVEELVALRLCPAYIVPQKPLFDRCLPAFSFPEVVIEQAENTTEALNGTQTDNSTESDFEDEGLPLQPLEEAGLLQDTSLASERVEHEEDRGGSMPDPEGLGDDSLILPHPNTVLKIVNARRGREKREALLVAEPGSYVEDQEQGEKEGKAVAAALFSGDQQEEDGSGMALDFTDMNDPMMNVSKRAVNLSDLMEGADQLRKMLDLQSLGERILWDLSNYWWILLLYLLLAFVLSLLWVLLLSVCAKPTVWLSLLASTIGLCLILGVHCYNRYDALNQVTEPRDDIFLTTWERLTQVVTSSANFWLVLTVLFFTLGIVLCLTLGCCMQRLRVATEMISEASKAIRDIKFSLVMPLFPFLLHLLVLAWSLTVGLFLLSAREAQYHVVSGCEEETCTDMHNTTIGTWDSCKPEIFANCTTCPEAACVFHRYGSGTLHFVLGWYNLFAALWTAAFISAAGDLVLAGAVSAWYWTFNKQELEKNILGSSIKRTARYHLGTVAFGSLLLALIQFLRVVVEYINDRINNLQSSNKLLKSIIWFLRGCFFVLEKLIRYLNRNAYIMTAMVGSGFCRASQDAFTLITSNILRGFFVHQVADFVILLGKAFVVGLTTLFFSMSVSSREDELHFSFIPILLIMLGSYTVASSCLAVYSVAVDTLFLCFLKDIQINDGGWRKPYYMSTNLMKIMKYENV